MEVFFQCTGVMWSRKDRLFFSYSGLIFLNGSTNLTVLSVLIKIGQAVYLLFAAYRCKDVMKPAGGFRSSLSGMHKISIISLYLYMGVLVFWNS